ncbi:hypothetical protein L6J37_13295 [Photobacterium sp. WH77]|uniref:hypothetical protein n=1 Tax=Photobacterium sp. WH77 TaxID=2913413 RepID=UPI001EDA706C|nr:hypothetical protein [Photobacterium sp. WH77]MCG2837807.1 hypothetical protein [Photobacterium sp. WH77]MCG2845424.1 hypothetical protein [Photobacterium sp. WH80]
MEQLFNQTRLIILSRFAADGVLWFVRLSRILLDHLSSQNDNARYLSLLDHLSSVIALLISACNRYFPILYFASSEREQNEKMLQINRLVAVA